MRKKKYRLFFVSVLMAVFFFLMRVSVYPEEDELDAILKSMERDETALAEQLKAARSYMTAEVWAHIKDPSRPGARERDPEAEAVLHAKGIDLLDDIEALREINVDIRVELYRLRMLQYSQIKRDSIKFEEYGNRILQLEGCPPAIAFQVERQLAGQGGLHSVFEAYYVECLPEDIIERRKENSRKFALKQIASGSIKENHALAGYYEGLGRMYWEEGENDEAEKYLLEIIRNKDVLLKSREVKGCGLFGNATMYLASIELRRGNREKALQYCRDLIAEHEQINVRNSWYSVRGRHAERAVRHWKDDYAPDLDNMKLPYFTDCKPFPAPKEPDYTDRFVNLKSVRFEGGQDFPADHPLFRLITVKFNRYGIAVSDKAPFTIKVNTARHPETPDRPQGYYLEISDKEAVVSGNDYQGTVWGVVSFIQCVDPEKAKARICRVRDWPTTLRRGHSGYGDDLAEFALFNKLNFFFNQSYHFVEAFQAEWDVKYENLKFMAKPFVDFGMEFYVSDRTPMVPKMSLTSDRTFQYNLNRNLRLAGYGIHITMTLDDHRYPLNPIDAEVDGGKGWRIDNQYVQKLYAAVREKYPDVKMVFCPTYYWGPHWRDFYSDTRAEYFKGIRTYLDPEIKVFWSGNQVKGYGKTKEQVQWFIDSANRKPMVWQNAKGIHYAMGYGCEVIPWHAWHYQGFFENDITGFMANSDFPHRAIELAHMAEALWNPDAYRKSEEGRENSLRRATDQLCGQGVYDLLRPGTRALAYMDRYLWSNGMTLNPELYEENPYEIRELLEIADGGMKKAMEINPNALSYSGHYNVPVRTMQQLLAQYDNPTSYYNLPEYSHALGANIKFAEQEAGYNRYADVLGNAFDFHIGKPVIVNGRCCVQYFPRSASRKGVWKFSLPEFPADYELKICGRLAGEHDEEALIKITLNEKELYEGPAKFTNDSWTFMDFKVSWMDIMERDNILTVKNVTPREKWAKPVSYYINYAVFKQVKTSGAAGGDTMLQLDGLF